MEVNGNAEHHANIPEWGLEDARRAVLYDNLHDSLATFEESADRKSVV